MIFLFIIHYVLIVIAAKLLLREEPVEWQEHYLRAIKLSKSQTRDLTWFLTYFPVVNTLTVLFLLIALAGFLPKKLKS